MKLEVGMYVRTKYGIEKIKFIDENFSDGNTTFVATDNDEFRGAYNGKFNGFTTRNDVILKASHNIIDLIKKGDYVNGQYVVEKFYDYANNEWNIVIVTTSHLKVGKNRNDIQSIVTKEAFKSMEYRLGDR